MPYTKTTWVDGSAPAISAANLNNIEQGVADSLRIDGTTTMTGQIVTVAGSATTPAIAPTGDSNNGIFFPATDVIALSTAGSERVRVTSAGNIGIGTTSPDVFGRGYTGTILGISSAGQSAIQLNSATGNAAYLDLGVNGSRLGYVQAQSTDLQLISVGSIPLYLGTNNAVRATITSAGNVGIGTTSPSATLEVKGNTVVNGDTAGTTTYLQFKNNGTDLAIFGSRKAIDGGTLTNLATYVYGNNNYSIFTNNTERITITGAGNIGIGTTSPNRKLEIDGSSGSTPPLRISNTVNNNVGIELVPNSTYYNWLIGSAYNVSNAIEFTPSTAVGGTTYSTPSMVINSSGRVGIGTNSPSAKLELSDGTVIGQIDTVSSSLYFGTKSNHPIILFTNNTEKMRLTTAGYLLVGYTTSNGVYPLQVNGQIFATSSTIATSDQRYKENVTPLTGALSLVNALNPVQFDWKDHPVHNFNTEQPTVGFLAQEVAEVLKDQPYLNSVVKKSECTWETETGEFVEVTKQFEVDGELVDETVQEAVKETHTEEFYGIAESNLIAILTKAVQELSAKVTALEAQIKA